MTDDTYHMLQVTLICVLLFVLGFKAIRTYPEVFAGAAAVEAARH